MYVFGEIVGGIIFVLFIMWLIAFMASRPVHRAWQQVPIKSHITEAVKDAKDDS